jgi:hypothetical protein
MMNMIGCLNLDLLDEMMSMIAATRIMAILSSSESRFRL